MTTNNWLLPAIVFLPLVAVAIMMVVPKGRSSCTS